VKRRGLFKFLFGLGLGVVVVETYERLYNIPALERAFRKEIEYWLGQYLDAKRKSEELSSKLKTKEEEIDVLQKDVSYWRSQYNSMQDEVNELNAKVGELSSKLNEANEKIYSLEKELDDWKSKYESTREEANRLKSIIGSMDELERESVDAISYYREKMNEAINNLKRTIEKYRAILGDDRVAFESSTVKILEDLKLTQEKLQKVLPYFPLILNFAWKPTKVINDKIYDINVSFEVASPLNSLREVEVMLIPVEYRYFITKYGMREEDYDKVFPEEEIRSVKIEPRNLEREIFSVDFEDLKGGREYIVKARVKDVAGSEKRVEVKTPYIRQFENFGKELYDKGIIVSATYYPLYPDPHPWDWLSVRTYPILGKYDVRDDIIISKHIDWATGHGINTFFVSWGIFEDEDLNMRAHQNTIKLINNQLAKQIHISILYELPHRLRAAGIQPAESGFIINRDDDLTKISNDFRIITDDIIKNSNFLYIEGRPVIYLYETKSVNGKIERLIEAINAPINKEIYTDAFLISDHATPIALPPYEEFLENALKYDGWTLWAGGYFRDRSYSLDYLENGLIGWRDISKNYSKLFIPSIIPGFTDPRDPKTIPYPRNIDNFKKAIELALQYSYTPYLKGKPKIIIRVDTFNEWGEDTGIEPTVSEQMSYLEALKEKLTSYFISQ